MVKCIRCFGDDAYKILQLCINCCHEMDTDEVKIFYKIYYSRLYDPNNNSPKEDLH